MDDGTDMDGARASPRHEQHFMEELARATHVEEQVKWMELFVFVYEGLLFLYFSLNPMHAFAAKRRIVVHLTPGYDLRSSFAFGL